MWCLGRSKLTRRGGVNLEALEGRLERDFVFILLGTALAFEFDSGRVVLDTPSWPHALQRQSQIDQSRCLVGANCV